MDKHTGGGFSKPSATSLERIRYLYIEFNGFKAADIYGFCPSAEEILSGTFAHAKLLLRAIIKPQDFESLFPPPTANNTPENAQHVSSHTLVDVQRCVKDAQTAYDGRVGLPPDAFQQITTASSANSASSAFTNPITPLSRFRAQARVWLTRLSEKLVYYGNIFDVMAQHHPEYVSLAWGTFKLLFVVSTHPSSYPFSRVPKKKKL